VRASFLVERACAVEVRASFLVERACAVHVSASLVVFSFDREGLWQ
jgi:hypothetical protein